MCAGGFRVGWGSREATGASRHRAVLCQGSAASAIDLHARLPKPWTRSAAIDVRVEADRLRILGTVVHTVTEGHLEVNRAERIVLWEAALG